jgi:hypothetical protein
MLSRYLTSTAFLGWSSHLILVIRVLVLRVNLLLNLNSEVLLLRSSLNFVWRHDLWQLHINNLMTATKLLSRSSGDVLCIGRTPHLQCLDCLSVSIDSARSKAFLHGVDRSWLAWIWNSIYMALRSLSRRLSNYPFRIDHSLIILMSWALLPKALCALSITGLRLPLHSISNLLLSCSIPALGSRITTLSRSSWRLLLVVLLQWLSHFISASSVNVCFVCTPVHWVRGMKLLLAANVLLLSLVSFSTSHGTNAAIRLWSRRLREGTLIRAIHKLRGGVHPTALLSTSYSRGASSTVPNHKSSLLLLVHAGWVLRHSVLTFCSLLSSSIRSGSKNVLAVCCLLVCFKHQQSRLSRIGVITNYYTYTAIIVDLTNLKFWFTTRQTCRLRCLNYHLIMRFTYLVVPELLSHYQLPRGCVPQTYFLPSVGDNRAEILARDSIPL